MSWNIHAHSSTPEPAAQVRTGTVRLKQGKMGVWVRGQGHLSLKMLIVWVVFLVLSTFVLKVLVLELSVKLSV